MRESAWVGAGFVLQYSAQAARAVFLTRILTPHALGIYFVLRAIAVAGSMATQLGLGTVGLRRVAAAGADHAGIRAALRGVFILTAQTSVVGTLLAILAGWATGLALVDAALVGLMLAALTWTATLADLGRGLGRTAAVSGIERVFGSVADLAALLALYLTAGRSTLTDVLAVTTGANVVTSILLAGLVGRAAPGWVPGEKDSVVPARELLDESLPIAGNTLLWKALAELDLWLVALLGTPAAAAVYGIALRLAVPLDLPKSVIAYQLSPRIAHVHALGQTEALERMLKRWARRATVTTGAAYLAVIGIGTQGLDWLFGPDYAAALPLFVVLGIGRILSAAAGLPGVTLLMTGHSRVIVRISMVSTVTTATVALLLIPRLGAMGAAVAASTGYTIQCALMTRAVRQFAGVSVHAGPRVG